MRCLALLVVAACGGSSTAGDKPATARAPTPVDAGPGPDFEAELARVEEIARQACRCRDAACLDAADRAYAAYLDVATLDDPVTGIQAWPEDLNARGQIIFDRMTACFEALDVPRRHARVRYMVREAEMYAAHACECTDDVCRERTLAAFYDFDWEVIASNGDDHALAARLRGAVSSLARCLAPVLEDEVAEALTVAGDFRDRVCACADLTCAALVAGEMVRWVGTDVQRRLVVLPDSRVVGAIEGLNACLKALGAPTPPP
jgi:hypothetical protein